MTILNPKFSILFYRYFGVREKANILIHNHFRVARDSNIHIMRNGYNKIIAINGHGLLNQKVRDGNDALIDPNFKFAGRWINFLCNDRTIFHLKKR